MTLKNLQHHWRLAKQLKLSIDKEQSKVWIMFRLKEKKKEKKKKKKETRKGSIPILFQTSNAQAQKFLFSAVWLAVLDMKS